MNTMIQLEYIFSSVYLHLMASTQNLDWSCKFPTTYK